jgi:hypothetical protein
MTEDEQKKSADRIVAEVQVDELDELDGLLAAMPLDSPPDALVARTLAAVAADPDVSTLPSASAEPPGSRRRVFEWHLVAAMLLVAFMLAAAVMTQFGGKMKALFETSDAEIDTVDSNH